MVDKVYYVNSQSDNVYSNLALEEYLFKNIPPCSVIMYLWQNRKTVVIGRNQSAFKECRVSALESDDGRLARRLSGGGAVFHDMGNLNFTFLAHDGEYDVDKQLEVILSAVKSFGISAEKTGRNDITAGGRKFSGNAFYKSGGSNYHHGTLLVSVDMNKLTEYLNVSKEKLSSKGVSSVRSRVVNLSELCADITIEKLSCRLTEAFSEVYGRRALPLDMTGFDKKEFGELERKYSSEEFKFGEAFPCEFKAEKRFQWGGIEFLISLKDGKIDKCAVYSDCMNPDFIDKLKNGLLGKFFSMDSFAAVLNEVSREMPETGQMAEEIEQFIRAEI